MRDQIKIFFGTGHPQTLPRGGDDFNLLQVYRGQLRIFQLCI